MTEARCGDCRHFVGKALELERELPQMKVLSSGMGSVRADTGWCRSRDLFCVPDHGCEDFEAEEA